MSITLHNGYRLPADLTLDSIFQWLPLVKAILRPVAMETFVRAVVEDALRLHDKGVAAARGVAVNGERLEGNQSPFWEARYRLLQNVNQTQREKRRNPLDPDTHLSVFRSHQGLFGLLFSCSRNIQDAFASIEGVEEFFYYNNTDGPEGIPQEEWAARGALWKELIGKTGIPAENSASFQLVPADFYLLEGMPEMVGNLAEWFSLEGRAREVAMATSASALPLEEAEEAAKSQSLVPHMVHLRRLKEGKVPAFNQACARIRALLPEEVTLADLQQSVSDLQTRWAPARDPGND